MNRPEADAVAADLYPAHAEAAAPLIAQATDTRPSETRDRAARALRALDPSEPCIPEPGPAEAETVEAEETAAAVLERAGVSGLPKGADAAAVESALRSLGQLLASADPLRRLTSREEAVRRLRAAGVSSPAKLVDAALGLEHQAKSPAGQGRPVKLEDPKPWPSPVDGAELLDAIAAMISRYVVLPDGAAELVALWIAHAYMMSCWDHTGYLAVVSPTKRCGKTTLLRILCAIAYRALTADNVSPAALYRVVEESAPTLVIDEVDRIPRDADLWGVLNSGHTRGGAVLRTVGDDHEPRAFGTYCAKVLAYVRGSRPTVPDTVEDRCIRIVIQRRAPGERRDRLRSRTLDAEAKPLRRRLMRWADDHRDVAAELEPLVPEDLDDRAADSWEPLLAVADAVAGRWPDLARQLAVQYSSDRAEEEGEAVGVLLLRDLGSLLASQELRPDPAAGGFSGETIVRVLHGLEDRPWRTWGRQEKPIAETGLSRLLRPFDVRPLPAGPKHARVRRYPEDRLRAAVARFEVCGSNASAPTCTPAHRPESGRVSDSVANGVRVCGPNPHTAVEALHAGEEL